MNNSQTDRNTDRRSGPAEDTASASTKALSTPDITGHIIFWSIAAGGLALDIWSKTAVFKFLQNRPPDYSYSIIDGFLNFVMAHNDGAAFGIAAGKQYMLVAISLIAMVIIFGFYLFANPRNRIAQIAMAMFAAGIAGNLWDRLFNGGNVRDFIDVYYKSYHWYTFNVADSFLCVAVAILFISSLIPEKPLQTPPPQQK